MIIIKLKLVMLGMDAMNCSVFVSIARLSENQGISKFCILFG